MPYAVRFCCRLGKFAPETVDMMKKAHREDCLGESTIFRKYKAFKGNRGTVELILRPGRPITTVNEVNTNTILVLIQEDRHLIVAEIANIMNLSVDTVH